MKKIRIAVLGATGYTGQELLRILLQHPNVEAKVVTSRSYVGKTIDSVFANLKNRSDLLCQEMDLSLLSRQVDLVFLALPHGEAAGLITDEIMERCKVIDLGADFRLRDPGQYHQWYQHRHANPSLLDSAVYGLTELNREAIAASRLIANPGCYATCSILALTPLLREQLIDPQSIIIDAKSGVSGAGRSLSLGTHFNEVNENIKAYAVASHRHTPEIEQELSKQAGTPLILSFTPHLIPLNRGILVTAYANLKSGANASAVPSAYAKSYQDCHFIRVYDESSPELPETRWVEGSNFCDIAYRIDERTGRIVVVAALDNLIKGAAGQAVQNMNLMFGLEEIAGLNMIPLFP